MIVRPETSADADVIRATIDRAFAEAEHSSGTESAIVDALRNADALTISLVAVEGEQIVGHVATSPVTVPEADGWFGLGPVAVLPEYRRRGIAAELIEQALGQLRSAGASGCVVLGDPGYYGRFGFRHVPGLSYRDVPPSYLQCLSFGGTAPSGDVTYHHAFESA